MQSNILYIVIKKARIIDDDTLTQTMF